MRGRPALSRAFLHTHPSAELFKGAESQEDKTREATETEGGREWRTGRMDGEIIRTSSGRRRLWLLG